jgi:hypothetical protein
MAVAVFGMNVFRRGVRKPMYRSDGGCSAGGEARGCTAWSRQLSNSSEQVLEEDSFKEG